MYYCKSMNTYVKRFILFACLFNAYLVFSLFVGQNTITNYRKYKNKITELTDHNRSLLKQRYQLIKTMALLDKEDEDSDDVLEEILRQKLQVSLPEEKIVVP